ncbi:MAG: hypothetical protein ABJL17_10190 [Parvibaculum sp.]|uniref:hypothetical protein n=1 Tax=Parvibaculum sp. TaxID=2024848 RepID=UPI003264AC7C
MSGKPRKLAAKYRFREVAILAGAIGLLALAVPRLWAYGTALPEDGRYWRLGQGEQVSGGELADLLAAYRTAADRLPSSPELQSRAAVVSTESGLRHLKAEPIREGRDRLVAAASRAPLRTDIWSRLAYAEFAAGGMTPLAVDALELSWLTGRLELPDAMRRLQTYLSGWDELPLDVRNDGRDQVVVLWRARHVTSVAEFFANLAPKEQALLRTLLPNPETDGKMLDYRVDRLPGRDQD